MKGDAAESYGSCRRTVFHRAPPIALGVANRRSAGDRPRRGGAPPDARAPRPAPLRAACAVYCFARLPFSEDELAQRFHAHILVGGRLFATGEPHPEFFATTGVLDREGRWYSMYPIGGPALLAVGMALHATWLVNPVLTALTACALYRFAAGAFGEGPPRASTPPFPLSPFLLTMGATEENHAGALALATLALVGLTRSASAPAGKR